jgi:tRNA-specific 2-thiouridylase
MVGENPVWCGPSVDEIQRRGFVQIRAHGQPLACTYYFDDELLTAQLDEPIFGLATGQAMAIYDGDRVVGSATICETQS